jgi:hypothetical protein
LVEVVEQKGMDARVGVLPLRRLVREDPLEGRRTRSGQQLQAGRLDLRWYEVAALVSALGPFDRQVAFDGEAAVAPLIDDVEDDRDQRARRRP